MAVLYINENICDSITTSAILTHCVRAVCSEVSRYRFAVKGI